MGVPQGGDRHEFKVTTPAEAGIAFLDGPRFGGYGAEIEPGEHEETERPAPSPAVVTEPRPEPARESLRAEAPRLAEAKPAPAREEKAPEPARAESPAPPRVTPVGVHAHDETPEERERRLRASKTEIVEVVKAEGAPARSGWWRRGG
jgi:hypothetical protein